MKRVSSFTVHPYSAILYFTTSRKAFDKVRKKYVKGKCHIQNSAGVCGGYKDNTIILVGVFDGTINTLTHEVGHAVIKILGSRGVPIDDNNSEAFCYLLGHLVGSLEPLNNKDKD
jgi:hypothetical protein